MSRNVHLILQHILTVTNSPSLLSIYQQLFLLIDAQNIYGLCLYLPTSLCNTLAISDTVIFLHMPTTSEPALGAYLITLLPLFSIAYNT